MVRRRTSDDFAVAQMLHLVKAARRVIALPSGIVRGDAGGSADGLSGRARHGRSGESPTHRQADQAAGRSGSQSVNRAPRP